MKRFTITFLTILTIAVTHSADAQIRKYSNDYMRIGAGARALAMGNSVVASTNDVNSGYWNPSGLLDIKEDFQISIMHNEYFAGIANYDYGAIALPIKGGDKFIALSIIRFGVDDIPNTLHLIEPDGTINYDNITSFSAVSYGFIFSYAQKIKKYNLDFGSNFKILNQSIGSFAQAFGIGLDVGIKWKQSGFKFGLIGRDLTSTFNAWSFSFTEEEKAALLTTNNDIPTSSVEVTAPSILFGMEYLWEINEKFSLSNELNIDMFTDGPRNVLLSNSDLPISFDPHIGFELNYIDKVFFRLGTNNIQRALSERAVEKIDDQGNTVILPKNKLVFIMDPAVGAGIKFKSFRLDYALTNLGDFSTSLFSNVISLRLDFNKKTE